MNVLLLSTLVVLLPMVPAFILFKFLPESSKAEAEGPYHKLKIKLGGAFAGYFVVVLLMSGLLHGHFKPESGSAYEIWKIAGEIAEPRGARLPELEAEMFTVSPPAAVPGREFRIPGIYIDRKKLWESEVDPYIAIRIPGYEPASVFLDDPEMVAWDEETKTIHLKQPIPLHPYTYQETQGQQAEPVSLPPGDIAQANVMQ